MGERAGLRANAHHDPRRSAYMIAPGQRLFTEFALILLGVALMSTEALSGNACQSDRNAGVLPGPHLSSEAGPWVLVHAGTVAVSEQDVSARIVGKDGAAMVLIPAGEFMMGSDPGELERLTKIDPTARQEWVENEFPRHRVSGDAFFLEVFEGTNRLFGSFVRSVSSHSGGPPFRNTARRSRPAGCLSHVA